MDGGSDAPGSPNVGPSFGAGDPSSPEGDPPGHDEVEDLDWATSTSQIDEQVKSILPEEYEDGAAGGYPDNPFSPQPSTSMDEYETHVSPLDPNMSSAARYSPVYPTLNQHLHPSSLSQSSSTAAATTTTTTNPTPAPAPLPTVRPPPQCIKGDVRTPVSDNYMVSSSTHLDSVAPLRQGVYHTTRGDMLDSTVDSTSGGIIDDAAVGSSQVQPLRPLQVCDLEPSGLISTTGVSGDEEDEVDGLVDSIPSPPEADPSHHHTLRRNDVTMSSILSEDEDDEDEGNRVMYTSALGGHDRSNVCNGHAGSGQAESQKDIDVTEVFVDSQRVADDSELMDDDYEESVQQSARNSIAAHQLLAPSQVAKILSHLEATQGLSLQALAPSVVSAASRGGLAGGSSDAILVPMQAPTSREALQQVDSGNGALLLTQQLGEYGIVAQVNGHVQLNGQVDDRMDAEEVKNMSSPEELLDSHSGGAVTSSELQEVFDDAITIEENLSGDSLERAHLINERVLCESRRLRRSNRNSIPVVNNTRPAPREDDAVAVSSKDFWCDECGSFYNSECPQHKVQAIVDKPVPSRAWASLPATYLSIAKVPGTSEYGVFAKKTIPKRTQFGPVEGVLVKPEHWEDDRLALLVEMETGVYYQMDITDENSSNWMRFVRPADCFHDQNLVLSQQGTSLYFTSTRVVCPRQELRIGYSTAYAQRRCLPVLQPTEEDRRAMEEQENTWPCFECHQRFPSSEELQKHLNEHDKEKGDGEAVLKSQIKRSKPHVKKRSLTHHHLMVLRKSGNVSDNSDGVTYNGDYKGRSHRLVKKIKDHHEPGLVKHSALHSGLINGDKSRHFRRHRLNKESLTYKALLKKKEDSSSEEDWQCPHCNLAFELPALLSLHILSHSAIVDGDILTAKINSIGPKRECPLCRMEFESKQELSQHVTKHGRVGAKRLRGVVNPAKPFKCDLCYKSFATDERLERHMLVHGAEDSKPLQCDICYKRFLNNSALACHIKIHTDERKNFECPICRDAFEQVLALKEHVHVHARNGLFTCPHCGKVFEEYNQIRKHIRAFHSERRFPCSQCDKVFPRPDKLRLHMLRHSDHREFLCANCGKQFKRKDKLKEHMRRMHSAEREARLALKPTKVPSHKKFVPKVSPTDYHRFIYKCHSCLLGFKRRGMLVNHLAKRHPDISPNSVPELNLPILKTTRNYYCQYCEKTYKSSSKRKAHILKNHPGAELPMSNRRKGGVPEIPGVPNPTFSQTVGSVTTHPHSCPWCHKQYASKAKLLQHQRKKHVEFLPEAQQILRTQRTGSQGSPTQDQLLEGSAVIKFLDDGDEAQIVHIQEVDGMGVPQVNVLQDYQLATAQDLAMEYANGIITLKRPLKGSSLEQAGLPIAADLLSQAMSDLGQPLGDYRPQLPSPPSSPSCSSASASPSSATSSLSCASVAGPPIPSSTTAAPTSDHFFLLTTTAPASSPVTTTSASSTPQLIFPTPTTESLPQPHPQLWAATYSNYTAR